MKRSKPSYSRANIPLTGIHPNDLKILEDVLRIYLLFLRRTQSGEEQIQEAQRLHLRLQQLLASPEGIEGVCIFYTRQELRTFTEALSAYMDMLRQIIEPSPQRIEVLEALQGLQQQFATMLSAHLN